MVFIHKYSKILSYFLWLDTFCFQKNIINHLINKILICSLYRQWTIVNTFVKHLNVCQCVVCYFAIDMCYTLNFSSSLTNVSREWFPSLKLAMSQGNMIPYKSYIFKLIIINQYDFSNLKLKFHQNAIKSICKEIIQTLNNIYIYKRIRIRKSTQDCCTCLALGKHCINQVFSLSTHDLSDSSYFRCISACCNLTKIALKWI